MLSRSYDKTIKVWDRQSGTLVADITVGHIGKVLCVACDKNFVSCGEDYVCVSRPDRTPDVIDGYLTADMNL
jgi:WD40 repeat protein